MPLDRDRTLCPSLSIFIHVHSRGIARRREGTTIIYEDRKSRSIDPSDRSQTRARAIARSRGRQTLQHRSRRRGNTLTRDDHV